MGMIERFIGFGAGATALGHAAAGMAEIFTQNATRKMELQEEARIRAMSQFGQEFSSGRGDMFHSFVNGLNRLPRPFLALGTMGLFVYSMVEPAGFALRMQGLQQVPEPLWWLLGAIVGFYFGAREAHYFRNRNWQQPKLRSRGQQDAGSDAAFFSGPIPDDDFADNAALRDWVASLRGSVAS